jgi:hypothetical protein
VTSNHSAERSEAEPRWYHLWSYHVAIDHSAAVVDHVQHQSAAAVAPPTDRPRPLTTSSTRQKTFNDPAAPGYGSEGWGSSPSQRGHEFPDHRPTPGPLLPLPVSLDLILAALMLVGGPCRRCRGGKPGDPCHRGWRSARPGWAWWRGCWHELSRTGWPPCPPAAGRATLHMTMQVNGGGGQTGSAVQTRPGLDLLAAHDLCAGLRAYVPRGDRVLGGWR